MTTAASPLPPHLTPHGVHSTPRGSSTRPSASPGPSPASSTTVPSPSPRANSPRNASISLGDVDSAIRASGGSLERALEAVVAERNNLQQQNSQLWKLIEKQRSQCAHLVQDVERLRADREKGNQRLLAAGLEPINGKKLPHSSSVGLGLGLKADPQPQIRRNNSDRDEKMVASDTERPDALQPPSDSSAHSSPANTSSALLPSPIPDSKLRRESRMAFAPEVSSFLSLAESPRTDRHAVPPIPSPTKATTPPVSMTPSVPPPVPDVEAVATPPMRGASRVLNRPLPDRQSSLEKNDDTPKSALARASVDQGKQDETPRSALPRVSEDSSNATPRQSVDTRTSIEPIASSSRRPLPRLAPTLLPHTRLSIPHTTVYPNAAGRDVLCFIVSVTVRPPNAQPVSWNVAKLFSAFLDLDTRIKAKSGKKSKDWKNIVAPLPEGKAWKDFAPSKIDQRKSALEGYLQSVLLAPLSDKTDLCEFLSTDPVQSRGVSMRKEGYLTKKAKNFGGWRTRYFVLDGPNLDCYENRGGPIHSSILITNAQIGRQNRASESSEDRESRHAFLIIEQSKKGSQRHILCAESDIERDSWIDALVKYVDPEPSSPTTPMPPPVPASVPGPGHAPLGRKRSNSRKSSHNVVITAAQPMHNVSNGDKFGGAPSPSLINQMEAQKHSSPSLASQSSASIPSSISQQDTSQPVKPKRQSVMPSRPSLPPPSHSAAYLSKLSADGLSAPPGMPGVPGMPDKDRERKAKSGRFWPTFGKQAERVSGPVFGVPLSESIAIASVANLPAIVFRCIEWLEAKHAETEEGIYRLSGSSAVIKGLRDRFDTEGDVNLKGADEHWDPHAIAGLLKSFLRELPTSLLTRELHPRFLAVMDLIESSARVAELSRLVGDLPPHNYALLRALTAHLILIVKHAQENKMTLRNIGIVFSPTLGIPAGIFSELVSSFGVIFDDEPLPTPEVAETAPAEEETVGRKRNSLLYQQGGADTLLGLGGRSLDPVEDSASEADVSLDERPTSPETESDAVSTSALSAENSAASGTEHSYPSATAVRKAKKAQREGRELEQAAAAGREREASADNNGAGVQTG